MNTYSLTPGSIKLRRMLPEAASQKPTTTPEAEDSFRHVGRAQGLAQYIPTARLRNSDMLGLFASALSSMGFSPQYRFTARPINRLLGGPVQPMSSSMGSSFVTDMLWHQTPGLIAAVVLKQSFSPLLNFRPSPFLSTAMACGWGIPSGLYKLGAFQQSLNVQKLALQLSGNDPMLAREIGKLLKASIAPNAFLPQVGEAMLQFMEQHKETLPTELTAFGRAIEAGDTAALAASSDLLKCAKAYAENNENDYEFAAGVRLLNAIVPISAAPWHVRDENKILLQDAAKVGMIIGFLAAEWIAWGQAVSRGDDGARTEGIIGIIILGATMALLGTVAAVAKVEQRSARSQDETLPTIWDT